MSAPDNRVLLEQLGELRTELADLAYTLDRDRHPEAVDVAVMISSRLAELCGDSRGFAEDDPEYFETCPDAAASSVGMMNPPN